jgi:hypothetical protein
VEEEMGVEERVGSREGIWEERREGRGQSIRKDRKRKGEK